jgi:hypothetical protein
MRQCVAGLFQKARQNVSGHLRKMQHVLSTSTYKPITSATSLHCVNVGIQLKAGEGRGIAAGHASAMHPSILQRSPSVQIDVAARLRCWRLVGHAVVKSELSFVCRLFAVMGADQLGGSGTATIIKVFAKNELLPSFELRVVQVHLFDSVGQRRLLYLAQIPCKYYPLTFKICPTADSDQRLQTTKISID